MTYTISEVDPESGGSYESVFATLDITSLDGANTEPFDASAALNVDPLGIAVIGVENGDAYDVEWDHLAGEFVVLDNDGTDPTAETDVGEVRVRVDGDKGP
jgi:hypothetical protein